MRVIVIGDVHGQYRELADVLRQAQTDFGVAAAVQVGDFGFFREPMAQLRRNGIRFPVPLHAIDGNHEDHRWLRQAMRAGVTRAWQAEANLIYQPRASVARLGASTVGFLGGALHVDRPQAHNLFSRFPNYIARHHRQQAVALFNREKPELIVTHSCPSGIGIGVSGSPDMALNVAQHVVHAGFDPGPPGDCGEAELGTLWRDLRYRPRGWVFGHFHCAHEATVEGTRFLCVSDAPPVFPHTLVLWDTEEKKLLTVRS